MTELDIWRSANILLKRYGSEAVFIASKRADVLLDLGDVQGCSAWVDIVKAIDELESKQPGHSTRCTEAARYHILEPARPNLGLMELAGMWINTMLHPCGPHIHFRKIALRTSYEHLSARGVCFGRNHAYLSGKRISAGAFLALALGNWSPLPVLWLPRQNDDFNYSWRSEKR